MKCERCGQSDHRGLVLDDDSKLVCHRCHERDEHRRRRQDAAVKRRRVLRVDLAWCHPADRRSVGRRLSKLARATPGDSARILTDLAAELSGNRPAVTIDLTSVSEDAARGVATALDIALDTEVATAGPDRDLFVAIAAAWNDWRRAALPAVTTHSNG